MEEQRQQLLCDDVFYGAMRWMDGETLAIAGCVNSSFHRESRDEKLWEVLCARKWPSVGDSNARLLVQQVGGFQKLYSDCSRLISLQEPPTKVSMASNPRASNFASLVDVQFQGKTLLSRFVDGIPGAGTELATAWFSSCPFRVDLLQESPCVGEQQTRLDEEGSPSFSEIGKLWKEICEGMKLSWILIDKERKRATNLSSWRPILAQRHWPTDRDFILRYGSILAHSWPKPVECSIILKCRLLQRPSGTGQEQGCELLTMIKLTELSMQLKDVGGGEHLNGREGLSVLCQAVGFSKCRDEEWILRAHKDCLRRRSELKMQEMKVEWRLDMYLFLAILVALMFFLWML